MKKIFLITSAFVGILMCSCKKDSFDPGTTASAKVSNEWWANLYQNGQALYPSPAKIMTYGTADSPDSIWVDDLGNLWQFQCKAKFDANALTFQTTNAQNQYYNITVTLTGGKILPKAAHSRTGNVTDSIYMKAVFSDDPTTTYEIKGTARTNWPEDNY